MSDSSHKRSNSFRKLFPSLFFSSKAKDKTHKHSQIKLKKSSIDNSSINNQYENPLTVKDSVSSTNPDIGRIYENLAVGQFHGEFNSSSNNISSSNHSSSSTLVSETIKKCQNGNSSHISRNDDIARPQVPRKPYNELPISNGIDHNEASLKNQYPDVYYHSVEKLTERISPLDEIKIYRAVESYAKPASVGAEIKRVSTKFLISPKKEAEVRTIQPTRARSFSFENKIKSSKRNLNLDRYDSNCAENAKKSYNYSAPTSPIPTNHKIPNMPKTISPYGHVRKSMNESEEKKNSLNRPSLQKQSEWTETPIQIRESNSRPRDNIGSEYIETKEKARQKLEAFYWQKLRELKQKEDDYLLKHSFNTSSKSPASIYESSPKYNYSLPPSFKANSLPREKSSTVKSAYTSNSFLRGAPERRTDTFIQNKGYDADSDIIYRHPEKLNWIHNTTLEPRGASPLPIPQSGSLKQEPLSLSLQPKRVSFEEQYDNKTRNTPQDKHIFTVDTLSSTVNVRSNRMLMIPPRPPVRTTSVYRGSKIVNNHRIINPTSASHSLYSESESGSEAGDMQRILHSSIRNSTNGKQIFPESELIAANER